MEAPCSSPEKQLESDRRYISITYTDTTFESFRRTDRAITGVLVGGRIPISGTRILSIAATVK